MVSTALLLGTVSARDSGQEAGVQVGEDSLISLECEDTMPAPDRSVLHQGLEDGRMIGKCLPSGENIVY